MLNVVLPVPPLAEKNETTIITQSLLRHKCKHIFYNKQNNFCDIRFTALCNTMKSDLSHFVIRKTTEYRTFLKKNCYLCRS